MRLKGESLLSTCMLWGTVCASRINKNSILHLRVKSFFTDKAILSRILIKNIDTLFTMAGTFDYGDSLLYGCNKKSHKVKSHHNSKQSNFIGVENV